MVFVSYIVISNCTSAIVHKIQDLVPVKFKFNCMRFVSNDNVLFGATCRCMYHKLLTCDTTLS